MKLTVEMILRSLNQIRRVYVDRLQERMPEENLSPNEHHCGTAVCPAGRIQEPDQPQRRTADPTGHPLCQTGYKGPSAHPPDAQRASKAADRSSAGGDCRHQSQRPR